ncbi:hypothetical protein [Streptomyces sp. NPDC002156]
MAMRTSRFPGRGTIVEQVRISARSEDILRILELRGIDVSEAARERITQHTPLETLNIWIDRTLTVTSTEELFREA